MGAEEYPVTKREEVPHRRGGRFGQHCKWKELEDIPTAELTRHNMWMDMQIDRKNEVCKAINALSRAADDAGVKILLAVYDDEQAFAVHSTEPFTCKTQGEFMTCGLLSRYIFSESSCGRR